MEEERTFLLDNNPAKLLPYSKRLIPEDPAVETLAPRIIRNSVIHPSDMEL